jgi:hypothetical protein
MRFYSIGLFSVVLLAVIYFVGTWVLVAFGAWLRRCWKRAWWAMVPLFLLLYIAPIAEELWIAWNFGRLCRQDAGLFIYKTVEVEGFYNATGATLDLVRPGGYRFIESYSREGKGAIRLTFGDAELVRQALARYGHENPGQDATAQDVIRVRLDERTEALVYPKKGESWRITKLDRPTARYHYSSDIYGTRAAHKITRQESVVTDVASGEVLGRYVVYGRRPPWFFVGLGEVPYSCDGPDGGPNSRHNRLIYRDVLKPVK